MNSSSITMRRSASAVKATGRTSVVAPRMAVRAAAVEEKVAETITSTSTFVGGQAAEAEAQKAAAIAPPAAPPAPSQRSVFPATFEDVMAFGGSAPERTNGRLAMLGFVAALGAELSSGESVLRQLGDEPTLINMTFLLFIGASLVPAFNAARIEAFGPFTPDAEMMNGRAAMIGFAALIGIEAMNGGAALF